MLLYPCEVQGSFTEHSVNLHFSGRMQLFKRSSTLFLKEEKHNCTCLCWLKNKSLELPITPTITAGCGQVWSVVHVTTASCDVASCYLVCSVLSPHYQTGRFLSQKFVCFKSALYMLKCSFLNVIKTKEMAVQEVLHEVEFILLSLGLSTWTV